jgi:uncharacterized RDD family membrane protein YckC
MQHQEENQNLLTNFEDNIVRASVGKRLVNYIVDLMVYFILSLFITEILTLLNPNLLIAISNPQDFDIGQFLLNTMIYIGYMFLTEAFFNGKSLGKLVTGTRAVNLDGSRITPTKAMWRALGRSVPFSAFSALGNPCNPWWDRWTETLVMDEKLSDIITS